MSKSASSISALVLGENGQLARSIRAFNYPGMQFIGSTRLDLSKTDGSYIADELSRIYKNQPFQLIINTAAYTKVDLAEDENELCNRINFLAVGQIANWCAKEQVGLIHYSTDYVFSGEGENPWKETDDISPINFYGLSKARGEAAIRETGCPGLILRTAWVHSPYGQNFVKTMLRLSREKSEISVVNDQVGSPTFAGDLAQATFQLIEGWPMLFEKNETFHLANSNFTTWFDFSSQIFIRARELGIINKIPKVIPISSSHFMTKAHRPKNSRLCLQKINNMAGVLLPNWEDGLERCLLLLQKGEGV